MAENPFIRKRQKERRKNSIAFPLRAVLGLIALSLAVYMAFASFVGNPNDVECIGECEASIEFGTWVLSVIIIFGTVIAAGAAVGLLFAFFRRRKGVKETGLYFVDQQQDTSPNSPDDREG